jgi:hypothetical protein
MTQPCLTITDLSRGPHPTERCKHSESRSDGEDGKGPESLLEAGVTPYLPFGLGVSSSIIRTLDCSTI